MSDKDVLIEAISLLAGQDKTAKPNDLFDFLRWGKTRMLQAIRDASHHGMIALEYFDGIPRVAAVMAESGELIDMHIGDYTRYVSGLRLLQSPTTQPTNKQTNHQTNNHGGARAGAGRKPGDPRLRRDLIGIRLPGWVIAWLNEQDNKGRIVELALKRYYALQEPQEDRQRTASKG